MSAATVDIRVDRALCSNAERIEPGTVLRLPALAAGDMLRSGRCSLVHTADLAAVEGAVRADLALQMRVSGAARLGPAPDPWSIVH